QALCAERGVPCHLGLKVSRGEGLERLRSLAPDLILVATFKQILSQEVIDLPRRGIVNLHPSLLPRHRGPCPIQAALLAGDERTGVTAHFLTREPDRGDIVLQREVGIEESDTDGSLRRKLHSAAG